LLVFGQLIELPVGVVPKLNTSISLLGFRILEVGMIIDVSFAVDSSNIRKLF
jgi:hypothetical protein